MQTLDILKKNKHLGLNIGVDTFVLIDANDETLLKLFSKYKQTFELVLDSTNRMESYVAELNPLAYDIIEFSEKPIILITSGAKNISAMGMFEDNKIKIRNIRSGKIQELIKRYRMPLILFQIDDEDLHLIAEDSSINTEMQDAFEEAGIIKLEANGRVKVIKN